MSAPQFDRRHHDHYVPSLGVTLAPDLFSAPSVPVDTSKAPTYLGDLDGERLTSQLDAVLALMGDGQWRTLSQIKAAIGRGSEAGLSARLREIRNSRRGVVERRRRGDPKNGLWEYRCLHK